MGHDHSKDLIGRRLALSMLVTLAFVLGEGIAGYRSNSLALLSDAGHNLADALALAFSWYGIWIARRPSTSKRTFGYHRVSILAALVNALSLVVIALLIFWDAGVVVAGILIAETGTTKADPFVSMLIGALILWSSWGILKEAVNVLLEAIPKGMDMLALEQAITGVHGVLEVHDLHVWTVGSGIIACSCHVMVTEQSVRSGEQVLRAVTHEL